MDRRTFLKHCLTSGLAIGAGLTFPGLARAGAPVRGEKSARIHSAATQIPDLVAVRGAEPERMFDHAISALGGMDRFVKRGQTVVIKPNISWNVEPEKGATTNPVLISRIAEHCFQAGARKVYVFDHTLDSWQLAYKTTGMTRHVRAAGAELVPGNSETYYQKTRVPGAATLETVGIHELVLESDVFINVPILKQHGSTLITCALKNLMGVVWDRNFYHYRGLHQCIADFPLARKPDLNVVDAYLVMKSGGPRGTSYRTVIETMKTQIVSPDIVAADTAAALTWGSDPSAVPYIGMAERHGYGVSDLNTLAIKRIAL